LRGRSGLTRTSNGPINSSYKFRSSYRRKFNISRKLKARVALAQGHTVQNTEVINGTWTGPNGSCVWAQDFIGTVSQTKEIATAVINNMIAYKQPDSFTTPGAPEQYKIKMKVLNDSSSFVVMNAATTKVTVTCYPLLPRSDILSGSTPLQLITAGRAGDLLEATGAVMPFNDPRFTPFMCPEICMQYKILKPRTFTVHGGGKFNLQLRHSYDINNYTNNIIPDIEVIGKKSVYRPMLVKLVGELGLITKDAVVSLRHLPVNVVWKNNVFWQAHASTEQRVIYNDLNASRNLPIPGPGITGQGFVEEENLSINNFADIALTVVT